MRHRSSRLSPNTDRPSYGSVGRSSVRPTPTTPGPTRSSQPSARTGPSSREQRAGMVGHHRAPPPRSITCEPPSVVRPRPTTFPNRAGRTRDPWTRSPTTTPSCASRSTRSDPSNAPRRLPAPRRSALRRGRPVDGHQRVGRPSQRRRRHRQPAHPNGARRLMITRTASHSPRSGAAARPTRRPRDQRGAGRRRLPHRRHPHRGAPAGRLPRRARADRLRARALRHRASASRDRDQPARSRVRRVGSTMPPARSTRT